MEHQAGNVDEVGGGVMPTRRATLRASGFAALGIATLGLPTAAAASSDGSDGGGEVPAAMVRGLGCRITPTGAYDLEVFLDSELLQAGERLGLSMSGDPGGPWKLWEAGTFQASWPGGYTSDLCSFYGAQGGAGCDEPVYVQALNGTGMSLGILVGTFSEEGVGPRTTHQVDLWGPSVTAVVQPS